MGSSDITVDVLKPLVQSGLTQGQIAKKLGVARRTIVRRMKALRIVALKTDGKPVAFVARNMSPFARSRDPLLTMRLSVPQQSAALQIRTAYQEDGGPQAQDLCRMMLARSSGSSGSPVHEQAARARLLVRRWVILCRDQGVDHRPAVLIAGCALPEGQAGVTLGIGRKRAGTICKKSLDVFAGMMGWAQSESMQRRRCVWTAPEDQAEAV